MEQRFTASTFRALCHHYAIDDEQAAGMILRTEGRFVVVETTHPSFPRGRQPRPQRFALGDAVERTLSAVGITPERVSRVTGKPCGCKARKRRLNEWGYRQQERLERAAKAFKII